MIISLPSTNELSRYTQECKCPCLDTARNRFPMNGLHSHKPPSDKLPTLSPSCFLILFQPFTQKIRFNTITLKKNMRAAKDLRVYTRRKATSHSHRQSLSAAQTFTITCERYEDTSLPAYQLRGISQARNEDLSWRCLIELGSYYMESQTSWYCALWLMA